MTAIINSSLNEELFRVTYTSGFMTLDEYRLPPLIYIKECPIKWMLAQATCKKHAKHLAASIILGQPFA